MTDYKAVAIKKVVVIFCGLLSSIFLARFLGANIRADYALIVNASAIAVVFMNFGVSNSFQKVRRENGIEVTKIFSLFSVYIFSISLLFFFVLQGVIQSKYLVILLMASASLVRMQIQVYCLVDDVRGSSVSSSIGAILEALLLLMFLINFDSNLIYGLGVLFVKELVVAGLSLWYVATRYKYMVGDSFYGFFKVESFLNIFSKFKIIFQSPLFFILTLLIVVNYKADILLLGLLGVDKAAIGVFAVGVLVADYLWVFSDIFKEVQISRSSRGSGVEEVATASRFAFFITFLVYLLFTFFGYFAVTIFYGHEYAGSYWVALCMLFANGFMIPCKIIGSYYVSINRVGSYIFAMVAAVVLNAVVSILLIPVLGVYGALVGNVVAYAAAGTYIVIDFVKYSGFRLRDVMFVKYEEVVRIRKFFRI